MHNHTDQIFEPSHMTDAEVDALTDALYPAHCSVFAGVSLEEFRQYVIEPEALRTRIEVYFGPDGRAMGYTALHVFERTIDGREMLVIRMESGLEASLRGSGISMPFSMDQLVRCRMDFPDAELYYLGCFVSPMSYMLFSKCAPLSWPHPKFDTSDETLDLMCELADSFGLKTTADDHPLVRDVGWRLHDTDKDIERFSSSRRKEVRFYLEQNPGYTDGAGLLYLASLDWSLVQEAATAKRPTLLGSQLKNAAEHSGHGQRMAA